MPHPRLRSVFRLARLHTMLMDAALAENLPRSLTLPTGSPTDGLTVKGQASLRTGNTGVRVGCGSETAPLPGDGFVRVQWVPAIAGATTT